VYERHVRGAGAAERFSLEPILTKLNPPTKQSSCTSGAFVAREPQSNTVVIDTEGMLAVSDNDNERKRLLLKVLSLP